jgi:hypothetical protein
MAYMAANAGMVEQLYSQGAVALKRKPLDGFKRLLRGRSYHGL